MHITKGQTNNKLIHRFMNSKAILIRMLVVCYILTQPLLGFAQNPGTSATSVTQNISLKIDGSALLAVYNTNANAGTSTAVSMSLTGASEAGAGIMTETTNSDTRLRISSLVENGKSRNVTASITPNLNNTGTEFFVAFTKPSNFQPAVANGGTCSSEVNLTDGTTKTVVTGITTCWSGTGTTDGYTVTYRYAKADAATYLISKNIIITYTISAEI